MAKIWRPDYPHTRLVTPSGARLYVRDLARYNMCYGGRAGSKTHSAGQIAIDYQARQAGLTREPYHVLCARAQLKDSQETLHKALTRAIIEINAEDNYDIGEKRIKHLPSGSEFIFAGMTASPSNMRGYDFCKMCLVEEADMVTQASWDLLSSTLRESAKFIIMMNPVSPDDAMYQEFFVPLEHTGLPPIHGKSVRRLKFSWRELARIPNPKRPGQMLLDDAYLEHIRMKYLKDPVYFRHEFDGEVMARTDSLVFQPHQWKLGSSDRGKASEDKVDFVDVPRHAAVLYGMDIGNRHTPGVCVRVRAWPGHVHVEAESAAHKDDIQSHTQLVEDLLITQGATVHIDGQVEETTVHLAGKTYELKHASKGPHSVPSGVKWLKSQEITVDPSCTETRNNLKRWSYEVDRFGEVKTPVKETKINKDALDAVRYAVEAYSLDVRDGPIAKLVSIRGKRHHGGKKRTRRINV